MNTRTIVTLIFLLSATITLWYITRFRQSSAPEKKDLLIIGTNAEFPPFSFLDKEELSGFDIEIIKEVAKRLQREASFKNMNFELLLPEIQLGTIQVIAAGITPTQERSKKVFFTEPHYKGDPLLIVQSKNATPIKSTQDLIGKKIIVNKGYTSDRYVSGIEGIDPVRIPSPLISKGIEALQNNEGEAYISSVSSLQSYFAKNPEHTLQTNPVVGSEEMYALAVSKKYPDLFYQIQTILAEMEKDGTIEAIKRNWSL